MGEYKFQHFNAYGNNLMLLSDAPDLEVEADILREGAMEIDRLEQQLSTLKAVVGEIDEWCSETEYAGEMVYHCFFCGKHQENGPADNVHEDDCTYTRLMALMEK